MTLSNLPHQVEHFPSVSCLLVLMSQICCFGRTLDDVLERKPAQKIIGSTFFLTHTVDQSELNVATPDRIILLWIAYRQSRL